MDLEQAKDDILVEMLGNVVFDGWTDRALRDSASMAGYDTAVARQAFPGGIPDVVARFHDWADRQMIAALAAEGEAFYGLPVRERVARAVRARFAALEPHKEALRRLMVLLVLPTWAPTSARLLYRTVDDIWYAVGDASTDFSFYTRRASLAGILSATTLYWLNDASPGHAATWEFLDRRLNRAVAFGQAAQRLRRLGRVAEAPWRLAASVRERVARRGGAAAE